MLKVVVSSRAAAWSATRKCDGWQTQRARIRPSGDPHRNRYFEPLLGHLYNFHFSICFHQA